MLYSKDGSFPTTEIDDTGGWVEVPDPPIPPEGMEVVWWCPPGWVVRPPQPAPVDGYVWAWSQTNEQWESWPIDGPPDPGPNPHEPAPEPVTTEPLSYTSGYVPI